MLKELNDEKEIQLLVFKQEHFPLILLKQQNKIS